MNVSKLLDNLSNMNLSTNTARRCYMAPRIRIIASDLELDFMASSKNELQDLDTNWLFEEDF